MLVQHTVFNKLPLGSIRSAARIGYVVRPVINPHNLHIDAFYCRVVGQQHPQLLTPQDVLEFSPRGIVINDHEHLLEPEDAIRLKPILELDFKLLGLTAYVGRKRIGLVSGYSMNPDGLFIIKIYIQPTLLQRLKSAHRVFDRSSIKEITHQKIVFIDTSKVKESSVLKIVKSTNPVTQPASSTSLTNS